MAVAAAGAVTAGLGVGVSAPAQAVATVPVTTTVTDAAGNAIAGRIRAYPSGSGEFASQRIVDGVVSLDVVPGAYTFEFEGEDGRHASEYYNDKTAETADVVTVAGPTALAPVQLAANPLVSGTVVGDDGKAVRGVQVVLYSPTESYVASSSTRADGTFSVGAPAGTYKLKVDSGGGFLGEWYNDKTDFATADAITLAAGGASVGTVTLAPRPKTSAYSLSGTVRDANGTPIPFARVEAHTSETNYQSAITNADGFYRFSSMAAGSYRVRITDELGGFLPEWHADKADYATATPITIANDAPVALDAVLAVDPAWATRDTSMYSVAGTAVDSAGRPVVGAYVEAWDTPASGAETQDAGYGRVGRDGQFFVDTRNSSETQFKISVMPSESLYDDTTGTERSDVYVPLGRWVGGSQTIKGAALVNKGDRALRVVLPLSGGIGGTVTSEIGRSLRHTRVQFTTLDGLTTRSTQVKADGSYLEARLEPGRYKVFFADSASDDYNVDGPAHAPEWYDNTNFENAKVITVSSGKTATASAALGADMRALRKPEIKGKPYLGGKVTASPGLWTLAEGTSYTYEWLVDSAVVGTGASYTIPKNLKGKRLVLRVTASNRDWSGTALVTSQKLALEPKVKIKTSGAKATITIKGKKIKPKKIKGTVVAKIVKSEDVYGNPKYKTIGKAKIKNGKAVVTLKKLKKGKTKVTFYIKLKGNKLGEAVVTKKIKIKR